MNARFWIVCGALVGALGVSFGAFGAHGLEGALRIEDPDQADPELVERQTRRMENFETAAQYQMYHAPALVLVGLVIGRRRSASAQVAGWCFLLGVALFSGMLYAWVFLQLTPLVMIVPIGGTAYIVGWLALAVAGWQLRE